MKKEINTNALTSKENLPPPRLIKDKKGRKGRDIFDTEGKELFDQLEEYRIELEKTGAFLQTLLRKRVINLDESVSSSLKKVNNRMKELEETLETLKNRGFVRDKELKYDELDDEFDELMTTEKDKIEEEFEFLQITNRILGRLLKSGMIRTTDAFIKAVEAVYVQIKKLTP